MAIRNRKPSPNYPKTKYLSEEMYATPATILAVHQRAMSFAPAKEADEGGDGFQSSDDAKKYAVTATSHVRPTVLSDSWLAGLDRKRCHPVRVIEREYEIPGWVTVEFAYYMVGGTTTIIQQEVPTDALGLLSETDTSDDVANAYEATWGLTDLPLLTRLFQMVPRVNKAGRSDPKRLTVSTASLALWPTLPKFTIRRMIHPLTQLHDPTKGADHNKVPQYGTVLAWDRAPSVRGMNIKITIEKRKYYSVGPESLYLAGWRANWKNIR